MDKKTIKLLIAKAEKECLRSKRRFEKYDSHEDMDDFNHWRATIEWLEVHLTGG
jgi:hypothetical protein